MSNGTVVGLRFHTPGGVIQPGEPVLHIVPDDKELLVDVRLSPMDIDVVAEGLPAQVILPAFKQPHLPRLEGWVRQISADAIADPQSGDRYFQVRIEANAKQLQILDPPSRPQDAAPYADYPQR